MDSEGPGDPSGTDFVVQNRTGAVQHATVRCQTSTSTIFSEMIELESGETATYDDLPQELIELQISVADGPKGSKMYDAETVPGTVAAGVNGSNVLFETTTEPVTTAAELDDVFDDGGVGEAPAEEAASPPADDPEQSEDTADGAAQGSADAADGAAQGTSDTAESDQRASETGEPDRVEGVNSGSDRGESDSKTPDRAGGGRDPDSSDRRTANADAAGSNSPNTSNTETHPSAGSNVAGGTSSDASSGGDRRGSDGSADRSSRSTPDGTVGDPTDTTPAADDEQGPGPDEVHCRNCGEIIKQRAEICPECGTQNAAQGHSAGGSGAADTRSSGGRTTDSEPSGRSAADDSSRGPGPDEIYCRNCGEVIKQRAEICPECGTQNAAQSGSPPSSGSQPAQGSRQRNGGMAGAGAAQQTGSANGASTAQRQSSGSEPSGSWVNGVRFGALLWFLALVILIPTVLQYQSVTAGSGVDPGGMMQSLGLAALLPPVQLLAWVVLPLSLYFDLQYVGYHVDEWPLSGRLYIAGAAILPILTQVFGAAALFLGTGGPALAAVIPVILLALSIRHLRTRSRLV